MTRLVPCIEPCTCLFILSVTQKDTKGTAYLRDVMLDLKELNVSATSRATSYRFCLMATYERK